MFAEVGEIIGGTKTLPKIPDCGKKFIMFKSLGTLSLHRDMQWRLSIAFSQAWQLKMLSAQDWSMTDTWKNKDKQNRIVYSGFNGVSYCVLLGTVL